MSIINIVLQNTCIVNGLSTSIKEAVKKKLTIQNPAYIKAVKRGASFWQLKSINKTFEHYYEKNNNEIILPKGFAGVLIREYIIPNKLKYNIDDKRISVPVENEYIFKGELRDVQKPIFDKIKKKEMGLLHLSTGFGKSVLAIKMFSFFKEKTLIITNRDHLVSSFINTASSFLNIDKKDIGIIKGKKEDIKDITIASIHTLSKKDLKEIKNKFGMVIFDEVHEDITPKRIKVLRSFNAKRHYGMTATVNREDNQGPAINFHCGSTIAKYSATNIIPNVEFVSTNFKFEYNGDNYNDMVSAQVANEDRNNLIVQNVLRKKVPQLILARRKEHCNILAEKIGDRAMLLTGDIPKKEKESNINKLKNGEVKSDIVVIGTISLISTGFDVPMLQILHIVGDSKAETTSTQSSGRVLRLFKGKNSATIVDYIDVRQPIFYNQAKKRKAIYRKNGFKIK